MLDDVKISNSAKYLTLVGLVLSLLGSFYALFLGLSPGNSGAALENGIISLVFIIIAVATLFLLKNNLKIVGVVFIIASIAIFFTAGTIALLGAILLFLAGIIISAQ